MGLSKKSNFLLDSAPQKSVKALRFASMNANRAALTARTARRFAPPGRAFAFNAPHSAVPLRSK